MLCLSRKVGRSIIIDNAITITVLSVRGDRVVIGIDAPSDVPIHRQETVEAIVRNGGDVTKSHAKTRRVG